MARRSTLSVSLTPELEKFVSSRVGSGRNLSANEVIREGLRLLQEQERLRETRLQEIRRDIAKGLASLDRGDGLDGAAVFDEVLSELDATAS